MKQNSDKMKAVVLMSGGMDSCVTAAIARQDYQIAALHASYGQPTERRELQSFHALADHFGAVQRLIVKLDHFRAIGGSSLTDSAMPIPDANLANKDIPNTYVPFRNAHFEKARKSWEYPCSPGSHRGSALPNPSNSSHQWPGNDRVLQ